VPIEDCQLLHENDDYVAAGRPDLRKIPINLSNRQIKPHTSEPESSSEDIPSLEDISEVDEEEDAAEASGRQ